MRDGLLLMGMLSAKSATSEKLCSPLFSCLLWLPEFPFFDFELRDNDFRWITFFLGVIWLFSLSRYLMRLTLNSMFGFLFYLSARSTFTVSLVVICWWGRLKIWDKWIALSDLFIGGSLTEVRCFRNFKFINKYKTNE
jgi:hypothetical protein